MEKAELVALRNIQGNLAVEESCGKHQLFHQQLLWRKCIYNIMSVQLQPTLLLSTWCAVCYVCFIIQQRQILLDNVHSTAPLWGEIECRHTLNNVLLSTWCAVCYLCFHNSAKTNANLWLRSAGPHPMQGI